VNVEVTCACVLFEIYASMHCKWRRMIQGHGVMKKFIIIVFSGIVCVANSHVYILVLDSVGKFAIYF
jgi:hypothetical protein